MPTHVSAGIHHASPAATSQDYQHINSEQEARVQANVRYSEVLQEIKPLSDELSQLQASMAAGAARLQQCEAELAELNERKRGLQRNLTARTEEAAELKVCQVNGQPNHVMVDSAGCYQCVCNARLVGMTTFSCRREQHFACEIYFHCVATVVPFCR